MHLSLSSAERFLAGFHDADPGVTSRVFADLPALMSGAAFASSYECLAGVVQPGPATVVDLACGDGFLLSLLAARQPGELTLTGVDISRGELDAARRRLGPGPVLHQARAQALPLPDACADYVLCHMALMLMDDAPRALAEARRVLRPGGVFAAVVGASAAASSPRDVFISLLRQYRRLPEFESLRLGDRRIHTPERIAELFQPHFDPPVVEDIVLRQSCGPADCWAWFGSMYDLAWFGPQDRAEFERRFIETVRPLCDADGQLQHSVGLLRITAGVPAALPQ